MAGAVLAVDAPRADASRDWLARAERAIAEREYEASENGLGLQAPNRAHNLRTYFGRGGIRVHDRTAMGSPELLSLSVTGVGRDDFLAPLAPGEVASAGTRVEIRRPGFVEWYVNGESGLEQGFTLAVRPAGAGRLVIEMALAGAAATPSDDGLVFATGAGRRLRYAKLVARDAAGRALPASMEAPSPRRVHIVVDDAGAGYPLVIDPLLTEMADAQIESNQGAAVLGYSLDGAGDVNGDGYADLIVGAMGYDAGEDGEGAAFIFLGGPTGISGTDPTSAHAAIYGDQETAALGRSVAGAGDVNGDGYADVIVGAVWYDAGETDEGAAFVFLGGPGGIASGDPSTADATLQSNQDSSGFGESVAGAGDVNGDGYADVVVGAYAYDAPTTNEGAAFIFHGGPGGVASGDPSTADTFLQANQTLSGAQFGSRVAGAGDVNGDGYADVIVASRNWGNGKGAAFVFHGSATGVPDAGALQANGQLIEPSATAGLGGVFVDGAGDVNGDGYSDVIVSWPLYDQGAIDAGLAVLFLGGASGVGNGSPATADSTLTSTQEDSHLGRSVAGAGDVNGDGYADVIVGAGDYTNGQNDEGAAFVYLGGPAGVASGDETTAVAHLEVNDPGGSLGWSVAGLGDVNGDGYDDVAAGATQFGNPDNGEGGVFVYHGGAQGVLDGNPATAAAQFESNQAGAAQLGSSVAGAGDVNGDGYADVIVGARGYDSGESWEGAAFLFLGGPSGIADGNPANAAAKLESNQVDAELGSSVAGAGDVNGDGYADVIVGAWLYDGSGTDTGGAFLFHGSASGIANGNPATAATRLESDQPGAFLYTVAGAGDVNGDGYADVIVGAPLYTSGESEEGAAFVFLGSASGVADGSSATASARLESDQPFAQLGVSVAGAGDVNGDGYADVILDAWLYDAGQEDEGAVFVFLGSGSGIASGDPSTASARLESDQAGASLGGGATSVAGAGDVNGDGYADVIVASPFYTSGEATEGAAFVFHGGPSGILDGSPASANAQLESGQVDAWVTSVAGIGDVNGDGYGDVIVGSPYYDRPEVDEGAAFVFLGGPAGIASGNPSTAAATLETDQADSGGLFQLAAAGDVNGDGYADVLVGADDYDAGQGAFEGAAFLFYGNGDGAGRTVLASQLRGGGGSLPVQPWGASVDPDDFQVRMQATHPGGRGRVKLEIEACPQGDPFGDAGCTSALGATWTDVTASSGGTTLTQTVGGLTEGVLYRWRARVLHAPFHVTGPGIVPPPNPAHGPWRRLQATAFEADVRMSFDTDGDAEVNEVDPDDDGDGLLDVHETNTGTYVSPTDTGTDPVDSDSDDDGLLDGHEVEVLGTDPNDPDHDDDGDLDGADNCPFIVNAGQENFDDFPAGDACQCGDVTGDGLLGLPDYQRAREWLVGRTSGFFDETRCDVNGDADCDVEDLAVLDRVTNTSGTIVDACEAYTGSP